MPDLDLEDRLRSKLHTALGDGPASTTRWDDVERRLGPAVSRRRRRVALVAVAATVVVAVAAVAVAATNSDGVRVRTGPVGPGPGATISPTTTSTAPTTGVTTKVASTRVVATVDVRSELAMVARPDGVWYVDGSAASLVHVDPSGTVVGRVRWPSSDSHYGQYSGPVHLASGEGSIWVLFWATGTLLRIDPATMAVTGRQVLGGQGSGFEVEDVAAGGGHVWVTVCCDHAPSQRLYRIDPTSMDVDAQLALPGQGESQRVVAGPQGEFVTGEQFATVVQVDPSGTRLIREIPVPGGAGPVAVGSQIWAIGRWDSGQSTGTTLVVLDWASGVVHHFVDLPVPIQEVVGTDSSLWVSGVTGPIFDLSRGVPEEVPGTNGAYGLTASGDVLWYFQRGKLVEIAPST